MTKNPDSISWAMLLHLGMNMWSDKRAADYVRCDEKLWKSVTERFAGKGGNMIVSDIGEALVYPSHPELAVRGSWSPEKLAGEVKRLKSMGVEAIPKLNFSACHDLWLKDYSKMRATADYYRVVEDVIRDVSEIFGKPRYIHLGWDEEKAKTQRANDYMAMRQGELWWHDMLFTVAMAEKYGARGWIWSDKEWLSKDEVMLKCPRSVLQSHWYYSVGFGPKWSKRDDKKMREAPWAEPHTLCVFEELEKAGFDQMPCGSNIYHRDNFLNVVRHCRDLIAPERLKGFFIAPWGEMAAGKYYERFLQAADLIAEAREIYAGRMK